MQNIYTMIYKDVYIRSVVECAYIMVPLIQPDISSILYIYNKKKRN